MEDDHLVDIAEDLIRPRVLRDFTEYPYMPLSYDQHVPWNTWQYDLGTYLWAVDSCMASTTPTQCDGLLFRFALIDSQSDASSWLCYLTFTEIEGELMATFITIDMMVMMHDTDNEIEYIKTKPLIVGQISPFIVTQEDKDSDRLVIDILDSSGHETSAD